MRRFLLIALLVLTAGFVSSGARADDARLSFTRGGYWLTNPAAADFTLHQAAHESGESYAKARLSLYKLADPTLLAQIVTARALKSLSEGELLRRVAQTTPVWNGDLVLPNEGDIQVPVEALAGKMGAGVYVLTAAIDNNESQRVAQWFVRSTLVLNAHFVGSGADERSFVAGYDTQTRAARGDLQLRWCDADGKIVSEEKLPESGAALVKRPEGAALLIATGPKNNADFDYVVVPNADKIKPVDGALIYPSAARHETGKPFSFLIATPGENAPNLKLNGADIPAAPVMPGLWRVDVAPSVSGQLSLVASRDGKNLATATVSPAVTSQLAVVWLQKPKAITTLQQATLKFRLTNAGKVLALQEGILIFTPDNVGAQPALSLPFKTDAKGVASITVPANALPATAARYDVDIAAAGQQTADSEDGIRVYPAQSWLEIAPQFSDGAVAENVTAQFTVVSRRVGDAGHPVAVHYELAREAYKFEWYQAEDGRWAYRTKTTLEKVLDGTAEPVKGITTIAAPVSAGRYRLTVNEAGGPLQAAQSFTAGWWLAQPTPATPEKIELAAQVEGNINGADDKSRIAIFIDPPFAAHVWVAAINASGGAALPMVDVPDEGGFAYLPRTTLQPGQPLMLAAYGIPSDAGATLVQAEGATVLPLGSKIDMALEQDEKAHGLTLSLAGLPVDQPLDKNITQAFLALYEDSDLSLWETAKLTVDTKGMAKADFPAAKAPLKIRARLFVVQGDRLNVTEQVLNVPAKTPAKAAVSKKR